MSASYAFNAKSEPLPREFYGSANDDLFTVLELDDAWDAAPQAPNQWKVLYSADLAEVLSRVEDLWMRIKDHPDFRLHVTTERDSKTHLVLIRPTKADRDVEAQALWKAVQDDATYAWMQTLGRNRDAEAAVHGKSKLHSLVSSMSWEGGVLVVELTPLTLLNRQCGCHVESQVQGLLERIQLRPALLTPLDTKQGHSPEDGNTAYWGTRMRAINALIDSLVD